MKDLVQALRTRGLLGVGKIIDTFSDTKTQNEISRITTDSRAVRKGDLFVAICGIRNDGHAFLAEVAAKKCAGVLIERKKIAEFSSILKPFEGLVLVAEDTRLALSFVAQAFWGFPSEEFRLVGVTGTNGKTSTTYLLEHALKKLNKTCGVIGTLGHHLGPQTWSTGHTTPDALILQERFRQMSDSGAEFVALEVTSHALDQERVTGSKFVGGIFTNLTQDHLDYHKTMDEYFCAKQKLFKSLLAENSEGGSWAILPHYDAWGKRVRVKEGVRKIFIGPEAPDFQYKILQEGIDGTEFLWTSPQGHFKAEAVVKMPLFGEFNVQNALGALSALWAEGFDMKELSESLRDFHGVPGRLEKVVSDRGFSVFIDFAHTPDGLEKVLLFLAEFMRRSASGGRLRLVFGCGGDRDRSKRPIMAHVAEGLADDIIVTSDNPRSEDPHRILADVGTGLSGNKPVTMILDRREAIFESLRRSLPGDIVLIAGRGDEREQDLGIKKVPLHDRSVVRDALNCLFGGVG